MYQPKRYKKEDRKYIFRFINEHPFATFILQGERLLATHIPILTEGNATNFTLFGHIAKHNEQFSFLKDGTEALLVFQGAHAYVSSSWYTEKDISTWDYSAVHVNVKVRLQSQEKLEASLRKLVAHFEKDQEKPLFYEHLPQQMLNSHLPQITGFDLEPTKVEAIAKLHQNSNQSDINSVVEHLRAKGDAQATDLAADIGRENND